MGRIKQTALKMSGSGKPAPRRNILDMLVKPRVFSVWEPAKAHAACRVMLLKAALKLKAKFPKKAKYAKQLALGIKGEYEDKKLCEALVAWKKGKNTEEHDAVLREPMHDADVEDALQVVGDWIVTPVRNRLHLLVWHMTGQIEMHPWAHFLLWFLKMYVEDLTEPIEYLFDPGQLLIRDGYEVQFLSECTPFHKVVLRVRDEQQKQFRMFKKDEVFDMYPLDGLLASSQEETRRLCKRVMELEAK